MASGATFTDLTAEGKKYFRELYETAGRQIAAGVPEGKTCSDGTPVAEVAAYNEYGTSDIPARPFLQQSFEKHLTELGERCGEAVRALAEGEDAESRLEEIGEFMKESIRSEITGGDFVPNAELTILAKGSASPLIDTGTLLGAIDYEISEAKEG